MRKATILCLAAAAQLAAIGSGTIPGTGVTYDHIQETTDSGSLNSLTTGSAAQGWSEGYTIQEGDDTVVLYVPEGMSARTAGAATETVVPVVYCAGRIYPRGKASYPTTFNNLYMMAGGYISCNQIGAKCGNITILSEDPDNPVRLDFARSDNAYDCVFKAKVSGSADSQLLFHNSSGIHGTLELSTDSDWSGFYGTLRIDDGLGLLTVKNVPVTLPGTVKAGRGCNINQAAMALTLGNLIFSSDVEFTNQVAGTVLTVTGTFDTGTNCYWRGGYPVTIGTLILGDGLLFQESKSTPKAVVTVTNRLEVGENITVMYNNVSPVGAKIPVLFMKLSPEAVTAGVPDLSGVKVKFNQVWGDEHSYLTTAPDPDVEGGLLVYATCDPVVYYNGPDEFANDTYRGKWLDPEFAPANWSDGAYPDDPDKIYVVTQRVYLAETCSSAVFPAKTLFGKEEVYLAGAGSRTYITNYIAKETGLHVRTRDIHFGGNIWHTDSDYRRVRCYIQGGTFYLDAAIHGPGGWIFESYYPTEAAGGATVYLTSDNSDWTGRCQIRWTKRDLVPVDADETLHTRIVVGDFKALGGNPDSFICNAMILWDYGELRFTNSTVQTASNRGFLMTNGIIRVDGGASVKLTAPVTVNGTFRKVGEGTLELGGGLRWAANDDLSDTTEPGEGENIVLVKEGAIRCASLDRADVTFSDNAGIEADSSSGAMDLTSATVTAEGSIRLGADAAAEPEEGDAYPVVKVTDAQALALGPAFKIKRSPWSGMVGEIVSASDGAGNVIFSVKYSKPGSLLIVR